MKDTGHICKCGEPATHATWVILEDDTLGWSYQCSSCWYEAEDGEWRKHTCVECGYWNPRRDFNKSELKDEPECYGCTVISLCRKCRCHLDQNDPACPDFRPREVTK